MTPGDALHDTLRAALPAVAGAFRDPWWIIGSAAMALSGVPGVVPQDVDVLCSARDADALRVAWSRHVDAGYAPQDDTRFRSRFARFTHLPMPLEAMGGLEAMTDAGWLPVRVAATTRVRSGDVPVPALEEQRRILRLFGRDKDLSKAALLERFIEESNRVA